MGEAIMLEKNIANIFWHFVCCTECDWFPVPPNTHRDTDDVQVQTVVTYFCHPGYSFDDDTSMRTIVCLTSGRWSVASPVCSSG